VTSQGEREQLEYITRALTRLTELCADGRTAFLDDWMRQSAALYELQTLAEAQRLSDDLRTRHPELPWRDIAAFRNRIVHGYLGVSMDVVWDIIEGDLPPIRAAVTEELSALPSRSERDQPGPDPS
jgi:uncharacterized protein with HEPN domain